jgi:hypothetical protein
MHRIVLGAVLCASLGLPANSADLPSGEKSAAVKHAGQRLVCHWVAKNRTLRPLISTAVRVQRTSPQEAKASPVAPARTVVAAPARSVAVEPARSVAVEPTRLRRPIERIALIVGSTY